MKYLALDCAIRRDVWGLRLEGCCVWGRVALRGGETSYRLILCSVLLFVSDASHRWEGYPCISASARRETDQSR